MKVIDCVKWLRDKYDYVIETYPVQKDATTYYYVPLYIAKEIVNRRFRLDVRETILKEIEERKTLFSGINSREFAKIDLYVLAQILKDYI